MVVERPNTSKPSVSQCSSGAAVYVTLRYDQNEADRPHVVCARDHLPRSVAWSRLDDEQPILPLARGVPRHRQSLAVGRSGIGPRPVLPRGPRIERAPFGEAVDRRPTFVDGGTDPVREGGRLPPKAPLAREACATRFQSPAWLRLPPCGPQPAINMWFTLGIPEVRTGLRSASRSGRWCL